MAHRPVVQGATSRQRRLVTGALIAFVLVVFGFAAYYGIHRRDAKIAGVKRLAETERVQQRMLRRLQVLGHLEPCLQDTEWSEHELAVTATPDPNPKHKPLFSTSRLDKCFEYVDSLLGDAEFLRPASAAPLQVLRHIDEPIAQASRDQAAFAAAVTRRHAAIRDVRAIVLPQLRDKLAILLDAYEKAKGRDLVWWQIHLRLGLWRILDVALAASKLEDGSPPDLAAASAAAHDLLSNLLAEVAHAPQKIQDAVDNFEFFTKVIVAGEPLDIFSTTRFLNNDLGMPYDAMLAIMH